MGIERTQRQLAVTSGGETVLVVQATERRLDQIEAAFRRDLEGREATLDHWDEWMADLEARARVGA